jgi:hypothetical protein
MFENYREWLEATGISTAKLTPMEVYDLATKVMHDGALRHARMSGAGVANGVRALSTTERAALRDRVLGVVQLGSKAQHVTPHK